MKNNKMMRIVLMVDAMKRGRVVSAENFAHLLDRMELQEGKPVSAASRTVRRDIEYLRETFNPPLERTSHGYALKDRNWSLPCFGLEGETLFAALFCNRVAEPFLPIPLQEDVRSVSKVELATGAPEGVDVGVIDSVVVATGGVGQPDEAVSKRLLTGWREARQLRIAYVDSDNTATERTIDIHALVLSDLTWYARAFCHLRQCVRSFALHRVRSAELLPTTFVRSLQVIDEVRSGRVFDYEQIQDVTVWCAAPRAHYFRERVWYPGQQITARPDGSLDVVFPSVPAPLFVQWVLAFQGDVTVVAPAELRQVVHATAAKVCASHN